MHRTVTIIAHTVMTRQQPKTGDIRLQEFQILSIRFVNHFTLHQSILLF
jgi:hypothetical protein